MIQESANGPYVILRCALCRDTFVAQASTNIANVTKHLVGQHWPALKTRIAQIKHAKTSEQPLPGPIVQSTIERAFSASPTPAPSAQFLLEGMLNILN